MSDFNLEKELNDFQNSNKVEEVDVNVLITKVGNISFDTEEKKYSPPSSPIISVNQTALENLIRKIVKEELKNVNR